VGVLVGDLRNVSASFGNAIWQVCKRSELDPACHFVPGVGWRFRGRIGMGYKNGSHVTFKSGGADVSTLEGPTYDAVVIDEVPKLDNYIGHIRGLRDGGPLWWGTTPVGRPVEWMRSMIEGNPETGEPPQEDWHQYVVEVSTRECPWLTEADVAERYAKYPTWAHAQRLRGAWEGPARERVYESFTDECIVHSDPVGTWSLDFSADHGDRAGHQFGVLLAHNGERVVVIDECYNAEKNSTPDEDARDVLAMLERRGAPYSAVRRWTADTNHALKSGGWKVSDLLSAAIAKRLRLRAGPHFGVPMKRAGSVELGERMLNTAFAAGHLQVHSRCKRLIRALYAYSGGKTDESKDESDACRYGVVPLLREMDSPQASALYLRN